MVHNEIGSISGAYFFDEHLFIVHFFEPAGSRKIVYIIFMFLINFQSFSDTNCTYSSKKQIFNFFSCFNHL